ACAAIGRLPFAWERPGPGFVPAKDRSGAERPGAFGTLPLRQAREIAMQKPDQKPAQPQPPREPPEEPAHGPPEDPPPPPGEEPFREPPEKPVFDPPPGPLVPGRPGDPGGQPPTM